MKKILIILAISLIILNCNSNKKNEGLCRAHEASLKKVVATDYDNINEINRKLLYE